MKRLFLVLILFLFVQSVVACDKRPEVKILAPGEYMTEETIKAFSKKHGIKVVIDEFASNEEAITFIKSGAEYDLILPSEYVLEQLIVENQNILKRLIE